MTLTPTQLRALADLAEKFAALASNLAAISQTPGGRR